MLKIKDIENVKTKIKIGEIFSLMTPVVLLSQSEFDRPDIILPEKFNSFEDLLDRREEIKNLKLVPIKNEYMHNLYNSLDRNELLEEVNSHLVDSNITQTANKYPYWLPEDVSQTLIWVKEGTGELEIYFFLARLLSRLEKSPADIILFERPSHTKSTLVKGTFPAVRHIHLWTKIITP